MSGQSGDGAVMLVGGLAVIEQAGRQGQRIAHSVVGTRPDRHLTLDHGTPGETILSVTAGGSHVGPEAAAVPRLPSGPVTFEQEPHPDCWSIVRGMDELGLLPSSSSRARLALSEHGLTVPGAGFAGAAGSHNAEGVAVME